MKILFSYDTTLNVSTVLNNHLTAKVNFMKIIDEKNWKCFLDKINYYNMTHNLEKSRIKIQPKTFSLFKKKKKKSRILIKFPTAILTPVLESI